MELPKPKDLKSTSTFNAAGMMAARRARSVQLQITVGEVKYTLPQEKTAAEYYAEALHAVDCDAQIEADRWAAVDAGLVPAPGSAESKANILRMADEMRREREERQSAKVTSR